MKIIFTTTTNSSHEILLRTNKASLSWNLCRGKRIQHNPAVSERTGRGAASFCSESRPAALAAANIYIFLQLEEFLPRTTCPSGEVSPHFEEFVKKLAEKAGERRYGKLWGLVVRERQQRRMFKVFVGRSVFYYSGTGQVVRTL